MECIVFLMPTATHPRFIKRIKSAKKCFDRVVVFSYIRDRNNYGSMLDGVDFHPLPKVKDGNYLLRPFHLARSIIKVASFIRKEGLVVNCAYAFNLETAYIGGVVFGWSKMCLEVGDLVSTKLNLLRRPYKITERFVLKSVHRVIVTSDAYLDFWEKVYKVKVKHKAVVIENKLDSSILNLHADDASDTPISASNAKLRIGLIGVLRYRQIEYLINAVTSRPESLELHVWGVGDYAPVLQKIADEHTNINFYGSFSNPSDLPSIYNSIHLNFVMYDTAIENVRLALPNKLYESLYFNKPMVVSHDTELCRQVSLHDAGFCVQDTPDAILEFFSNIDRQSVEQLAEGLSRADSSWCIHSDQEFMDLITHL